jgi:hypothetical protein
MINEKKKKPLFSPVTKLMMIVVFIFLIRIGFIIIKNYVLNN